MIDLLNFVAFKFLLGLEQSEEQMQRRSIDDPQLK